MRHGTRQYLHTCSYIVGTLSAVRRRDLSRVVVTVLVAGCAAALIAPSVALAHGIHGGAETIPEFLRLGIRHMIAGWDHLLFIAGVVLLAGDALRAAKLVSLFVAGHSLTLLVATLAGWSVSAELVDVLIALSLVYVGWRILNGRPTRWVATGLAVFGFGLVHGLGLSTRLQELQLPDGGALVARILVFNLGIELGQLAALTVIVGIAYLVRPAVAGRIPHLGIAGVALLALGFGGALLLALMAVSPSTPDAATATASADEAGCVTREGTPPRFGDRLSGGHPEPFHDVANAPSGADLQHVLQDGFVVVLYDPGIAEEERAALEDWAYRSLSVIVAPAPVPQRPAIVAHTTGLTLTCERTSVDALEGLRTDWLNRPRA